MLDLTPIIGAADDVTNPFGTEQLAELDADERFPDEACAALDAAGLFRHYVPAAYGGALVDYWRLLQLVRTVAARDVTVAVAHAKTWLGGVSVWVGGGPGQAYRLAERILDGDVISWGLTERAHGSDLLDGEASAIRTATGWRLSGEKWLINNATRGQLMCVLARTDQAGGPRGFSLFLVDKTALAPGSFTCLSKIRTLGIRGADISGIRLHGADLPHDALVGEVGQGIETVLKALQVTRLLCAALSLGAAEHGLRLAGRFAAERSLYGRRLADLPQVRRTLGRAATALLVAEVTTLFAARSVQVVPAEASVLGAVTKSFVPTLVQSELDELGELLGARGFLTDVYADGAFAKLERDHRIVSLFDGNTLVTRAGLIGQLPRLARAFRQAPPAGDEIAAAATLDAPLPGLDLTRFSLSAPTCGALAVVPDVARRVNADPNLPSEVRKLVVRLNRSVSALHHEMSQRAPGARAVPASAFGLAERYEWCFAGAAALHLWQYNRRRVTGPLWRDGLWLHAALARVLGGLRGSTPAAAAEVTDRMAEHYLATEDP
ncbi:acyl-CoA dehydrogenase family protein, partial [Micromonospora sp. NPDC051296]|uniref:acyl-CoA dehydrogenase family protein n=1 Tax=Micromonospora sp. NPDC051296 TaxID=3155046 RepID=UPI00343FFB22